MSTELTNAKIVSVYDERENKFGNSELKVRAETQDGRTLYIDLPYAGEGVSEGAQIRFRIMVISLLQALTRNQEPIVEIALGEYKGKPSVKYFRAVDPQSATPGTDALKQAFDATEVA